MFTHHFHPTILRAYDIRGILNQTLNEQDAYAIGRALGTVCVRKGGTVACVGRDGRLSSPMLEQATIAGLVDAGLTVKAIGLGPTPMLYYAQKLLQADVAVMITGSHNPPDHNGFKMMMGGKPFFGEQITQLGTLAANGDLASGQGSVTEVPMIEPYVQRILSDWTPGEKALTVVWDTGNGAAGAVLRSVIDRLPGRHIVLFEEVDGTFPNHHPDPTDPETLKDLMAAVEAHQADVGIAFDGDGDRIGVIDDQGTILWGDQILQIMAEDVLQAHPGATIIADVKASQVLFDEVARLGGVPLMWKTGHSMIKAKMAETGALLAGEMSGHIFFADSYYGFDDALYAAIRFLRLLAHQKGSLSQRMERIPKMVNTPELRFDCPDEKKFSVVDDVKCYLISNGYQFSEIDGVRVSLENGWWLLRASNTQAVLVARAESDTEDHLIQVKESLSNILNHILNKSCISDVNSGSSII